LMSSSRTVAPGGNCIGPDGHPDGASCLASKWSDTYFETIKNFIVQTNFDMIETDGPYEGSVYHVSCFSSRMKVVHRIPLASCKHLHRANVRTWAGPNTHTSSCRFSHLTIPSSLCGCRWNTAGPDALAPRTAITSGRLILYGRSTKETWRSTNGASIVACTSTHRTPTTCGVSTRTGWVTWKPIGTCRCGSRSIWLGKTFTMALGIKSRRKAGCSSLLTNTMVAGPLLALFSPPFRCQQPSLFSSFSLLDWSATLAHVPARLSFLLVPTNAPRPLCRSSPATVSLNDITL
jgi:hypothetical protein